MFISLKKQQEIIEQVKDLTTSFKRHWDEKIYTSTFPDYRRMANGELPKDLADKLAGGDYKYSAKLIPRVIPVAIEYLKTSIINGLFNRERIFDFVGRSGDADSRRAEKAYKLVDYSMEVTDTEDVCEEIIEDGLEVGMGLGEMVHHRERILSPQNNTDEEGYEYLDRSAMETIYEGGKLQYVRPETFYPENKRKLADITAYAKLIVVNLSTFQWESGIGGLYYDYAKNIAKLKREHFDVTQIEDYDVQKDHLDTEKHVKVPDFPVLANEFWIRMRWEKEPYPCWYVATVANWDNDNAQLLRFERDPMRTGRNPLILCRIYPKNNRLSGEAVPEKLQNYMLEKFHKRNQRLNLVNLAHDLAGMLITSQGVINRDSIYVRRNKILKISGNPRDVQSIPIDLTPLATSLNEEALIDKEVQEEIGTNPIALGTAPARRETATSVSTVDENARARANRPIRAVERTLIKPLAKAFLLHSQLFMPEEQKIRILGKEGEYIFESISRKDILGVFDVQCKASSELLTKGIKQALYNAMAQMYLANPLVRLDRQEFAREHFRVAEIQNVDRIIGNVTDDDLDADRENGALLNGIPWAVLEHDDHERHMQSHVSALQQSAGTTDTTMLENHIQQHVQMMRIVNGQVNVGKELPSPGTQSEFVDNMGSNMQMDVQ